MPERKLNLFLVTAAALAAVAAASLIYWPGGLVFSLIVVCSLVMEALLLRFSRPEVLRRGLPMGKWWEGPAALAMAVCAVAAAALSAYDAAVLHVSVMQSALPMLLGIVLLIGAFLTAIQSLRAQPPHAAEKYGEGEAQDRERGPYEVVRHPMMLAVLLGGLSIPLFLGSGIGFIPVGVLFAAVIARVAAEDDWRFNNYEWFYDYTKEVSYRLVPFIW